MKQPRYFLVFSVSGLIAITLVILLDIYQVALGLIAASPTPYICWCFIVFMMVVNIRTCIERNI